MSWQANLLQPYRTWTKFIDPDNKRVLAEILLGSELGFNPLEDKWAVVVVTEDV